MAIIKLRGIIENTESKAQMELDDSYESVSPEVEAAVNALAKATDTKDRIQKLQEALADGTEIYQFYRDMLVRSAHDKSGWHMVTVQIHGVTANGTSFEFDEDEIVNNDLNYYITLDLVRDPNGSYMTFAESI